MMAAAKTVSDEQKYSNFVLGSAEVADPLLVFIPVSEHGFSDIVNNIGDTTSSIPAW